MLRQCTVRLRRGQKTRSEAPDADRARPHPSPPPDPRHATRGPGPSSRRSPRPRAGKTGDKDRDKDDRKDRKKEEKEEPPVVTKHTAHRSGGTTLSYTATTGFLPLKTDAGDVEAKVFFMAYTLDRGRGSRVEAAAHVLVQWRAGRRLRVAAHGRPRAEAGQDEGRRRDDAGAPVRRRRQRGDVAVRHGPRLHRPGRHRLQPPGEARAREEVLGSRRRHRVRGRVHPPVPHALRALGLAALPRRRELRDDEGGGPLGLPRGPRASPSTASSSSPRS